jgi:SpoVK/Ycf46/Vps4 family AAA+-type ATPase
VQAVARLRALLLRTCGSAAELAAGVRLRETGTASRSLLLHGTAASGKKSLVRAVSAAEAVDVTLISPSALTDVHCAFLDACRLSRSVLIVDGFDVHFPASALDTSRSAEHEATLAERWARLEMALASAPRTLFVAVTRSVGRIAPAIVARFGARLELGAPAPAARLRIMEGCFEAANARAPTEAEREALAAVNARMHGMTAPDLARLFRFGALRALEGPAVNPSSAEADGQGFSVSAADLADMLGRAKRAMGAGGAGVATGLGAIQVANVRWSDVGGLDDAKRRRAPRRRGHCACYYKQY